MKRLPARPYNIKFQIDAFAGPRSNDRMDLGHRALLLLLDALVQVNLNFLAKYPSTPLLYESGVRYEYERPGQEEWQDIPTTLAKGFGDCEDVCAWRCAELIARYGVPARPVFTYKQLPSGMWLYHIRVWAPDGLEDPSRLLGMR